jgi:UDP-N-acetylglucosamine:LPS N-acetylglucosamine transferase
MSKIFSITVITGQGGGGHYATCHAIRAIAEQQQLPWQLQVTDMDDIVTELSQQNQVKNAYEMFGISGHDLYNWMLRSGWTWLWSLLMRLNKFMVKLNYEVGVRLFEQRWREQQPDLVVSVMPLFNKGLWESVQRAKPGTPIVTVLTDFADCPPDFWFEPNTGNYFVCGTDKAVKQARLLGVEETKIVKTSGLVIHPNFCQTRHSFDRAIERQRLGLDPNRMTALVTFGGNGSQTMLEIAKRLERFRDKLQVIYLCGRNEELAAQLRQRQSSQKSYVTTFTDDVPYYMGLADFFIGKPGNVSISEAIAMKLPVITERNRFTMVQERYCAEWIVEKGIGIAIPSFKAIDRAVASLIQPENYDRYRANLATLSNRAGFEVIELLKRLLQPSDQAGLPEASETLV